MYCDDGLTVLLVLDEIVYLLALQKTCIRLCACVINWFIIDIKTITYSTD
ncbi:hypothetical protein HanRHA438_Chr15g0711821 [Helianthus annuus]|uniref:Uncharacterized protein n=1 Tax=Helianthus annuus TaxID=4232 RepID=A0A9K3E2Z6_HELAN|nr:hypothetical protein HanXRQr2_Chr15g0699571 [Helianthus annuus]KAJ0831795.1 hypothetical protein HanPSC8_Chr15g0671271 [Helianthus annuus]KAJ0845278.1 hypothetical protein HanRHA438_Chr15g0711821 [Helianthus annuus]